MQRFKPASVIDYGCGLGAFLKVFEDVGVKDLLGIDGDWVNRKNLFIPLSKFQIHDLEKPLCIEREYDLALCTEVAEHLNEACSDIVVKNLTSFSKVIIFSAAIKNQGGQHHINEQPHVYWKNKFELQGYNFYDVFRLTLWHDPVIKWWYKQNLFLAAHNSIDISMYGFENNNSLINYEFVHPELLHARTKEMEAIKKKLTSVKYGEREFSFYIKALLKKVKRKLSGNVAEKLS